MIALRLALCAGLLLAPAAHAQEATGPASNEKYTKPTVDVSKWAGRFEDEGREVYAHREALVAAMQIAPGATVADLGAGTGGMMDALVAAVGPDGSVIATELSPKFRAHLKAKARAARWPQVQVRESFVDRAGLAPRSVDAALMVDVYHHLSQPAAFLADLALALQPGGTLTIVDYDPSRPHVAGWIKRHVHLSAAELRAQVLSTGLFEPLPAPDLPLRENQLHRFRLKDAPERAPAEGKKRPGSVDTTGQNP